MLPRSRRFDSRALAAFAVGAAFLVACASAAPATGSKRKSTPVDPGEGYFDEDVLSGDDVLTPTNDPDSGAFGAAERPAPKDRGASTLDGGPVIRPYCVGPLKRGDLQVEELLLSSRGSRPLRHGRAPLLLDKPET